MALVAHATPMPEHVRVAGHRQVIPAARGTQPEHARGFVGKVEQFSVAVRHSSSPRKTPNSAMYQDSVASMNSANSFTSRAELRLIGT